MTPPESRLCPRCGNVAERAGYVVLRVMVPSLDAAEPDFADDAVRTWKYVCPYCGKVEWEEESD